MRDEQTIQDVAMIARDGIARVIKLERENKRFTEAIQKANAQPDGRLAWSRSFIAAWRDGRHWSADGKV